ncbi:hypothetical protein ACNOYE_23310 [Nannocystaceae bacterium ST9]
MSRSGPSADFTVFAPDLPERRLVVELKRRGFDRAGALAQMKSYMLASNCPIGLIFTPELTWLLRDTYEGEDSIRETGIYPTATLLGIANVPEDEREFQSIVERWLESLTSGSSDNLNEEVRWDVARYVLPAVADGRVVAEH